MGQTLVIILRRYNLLTRAIPPVGIWGRPQDVTEQQEEV